MKHAHAKKNLQKLPTIRDHGESSVQESQAIKQNLPSTVAVARPSNCLSWDGVGRDG
jgi:hypothetical protein